MHSLHNAYVLKLISAKYEVILRLPTLVFCLTSLIEKEKKKKLTISKSHAVARKPNKWAINLHERQGIGDISRNIIARGHHSTYIVDDET